MGALRTSARVSVGGEVGENKLPLLQGGAAVHVTRGQRKELLCGYMQQLLLLFSNEIMPTQVCAIELG